MNTLLDSDEEACDGYFESRESRNEGIEEHSSGFRFGNDVIQTASEESLNFNNPTELSATYSRSSQPKSNDYFSGQRSFVECIPTDLEPVGSCKGSLDQCFNTEVDLPTGYAKSRRLNRNDDYNKQVNSIEDHSTNVVCIDSSDAKLNKGKNTGTLLNSKAKLSLLHTRSSQLGINDDTNQDTTSFELKSTNVVLVNTTRPRLGKKNAELCFKCEKPELGIRGEDIGQLKNSDFGGKSSNIFEPSMDFLSTEKGDTKGIDMTIHDSVGMAIDKFDTLEEDIDGLVVSNTPRRYLECISSVDGGANIYMDNLDIRSQVDASRKKEDVYGSSMNGVSCQTVASEGEPKLIKDTVRFASRIVDADVLKSDRAAESSKLLPAIRDFRKAECFENKGNVMRSETKSPDNVCGSSDEDLEEIVYKGEAEYEF